MKRENNPVRKKSRRRISAGKKKNKRTPILTALLLLMVCAATFGGFTVARYALSQTGKSGLASVLSRILSGTKPCHTPPN